MASLKSRLQHSVKPVALRSYLAEFMSTFIFVFAAVGATMSAARKMTGDAAYDSSNLAGIAMAHAFALSVAVYIASTISSGHVNPAVTFGMAIGGHITIPMAIFYWISQLLGSVTACLLLKITTVGQHVPVYSIPSEMTGFGAAILEGVMTFALVYTVYASSDPRRGPVGGGIGPLAIGLIVGANVLACGAFTGGSMNPAYAFGAALIGGSFRNQAVYWVGPMIGAGIAGIVYDNVMFPLETPDSLRSVSEGVGAVV